MEKNSKNKCDLFSELEGPNLITESRFSKVGRRKLVWQFLTTFMEMVSLMFCSTIEFSI